MAGVLLITGGSRGIGAATAICAARNGWDVAVNYARDRKSAERVANQVEELGRRSVVVQADMSEERDILRMFEEVEKKLGDITGLVNSAGTTGKTARVEQMTASEIRGVMELNVIGLMLCCREAVKRMSTKNGGKGGNIVNVASAASRLGGPNEFVHYAASKGAVDSFTLGFSREVAQEGVIVNAVSPGMIDTEIHASAGLPNRAVEAVPGIPIRRVGQPEEVAEAIVWLLGPGASYCAGAILPVTGGR
ncbi:MAG: NAD(P)-dependent oxidoreductase [Rhodospirillaceae bacterium]|nr:NAD(P)-dependent oxidoreductase [Rhodospirillaceae bacterium]|tara:strand:+ start:4757 stop:5503 length:747 start_codon:yes stop_codon:yes gene_type:complete